MLSAQDIAEFAKNAVLVYLNKFITNCSSPEFKSLIEWIKTPIYPILANIPLTQDLTNFIHSAFIKTQKAIVAAHYGINLNLQHDYKLPTGLTYTATQAVEFLNKNLNAQYEPHNIIELCLITDIFHAYIKSEAHELSHLNNNGTFELAKFVEEGIASGNIDINYKHPYFGLIRISKSYNSVITGLTNILSTLASGGTIQFNSSNARFMNSLQLSLADIIEGKSTYINLYAEGGISIDDIWFREEELIEYINFKKKRLSKVDNLPKQKVKRENDLHPFIKRVYEYLFNSQENKPSTREV
ncbi:MAG: hypothetical protein ACK4PR_10460, partial [Gammaproteobacteria bacterium]